MDREHIVQASPATPFAPTAMPEPIKASTVLSKQSYPQIQSCDRNDKNSQQQQQQQRLDKKGGSSKVPDYDSLLEQIPSLDPLPPPPVYDIVNSSTSQTLLLVSSLINTILSVNDRLDCPRITLFHSRAIPNISIEAYLSRILQYAPFQNEVLLIILLYFDRIGGGCKPTQVLTNTIPRSLLKQTGQDISDASSTTPLVSPAPIPTLPQVAVRTDLVQEMDSEMGEYKSEKEKEMEKEKVLRKARELEQQRQQMARSRQSASGSLNSAKLDPVPGATVKDDADQAIEEEEPIQDEIYVSSSESPVGSKLVINSFNIHRLLITSILVACKFSSDVFYPNVRYARVGGLPLSELNQLELEFLFLSQFELNTTESELQAYGNKLLMYHQRVNGTQKPAVDTVPRPISMTEVSESIDEKAALKQESSRANEKVVSRLAISTEYREPPVQEDDDEVMSEVAEEMVVSPMDVQENVASFKGSRSEVAVPESRPVRTMKLEHMLWPTDTMNENYDMRNRYQPMAIDEDAARIESEFNQPSPPDENTPKRKIQRLSSSSTDPTPSKRFNSPSSTPSSESLQSGASSQKSSNNILRPFLKKIASFASHKPVPVPAPEPVSQPPSLRSHPYLVRHRMSPVSSTTNLQEDEASNEPRWPQPEAMSPTSSSSAFKMKPPPPPYMGKEQHPMGQETYPRAQDPSLRLPSVSDLGVPPAFSTSRMQATNRGFRHHRSREPSLSSLASELTFEPTRSSMSPMPEGSLANLALNSTPSSPNTDHSATLAPLYFQQSHHSSTDDHPTGHSSRHLPPVQSYHPFYSTPPATPHSSQQQQPSMAEDQYSQSSRAYQSPSLSLTSFSPESSSNHEHVSHQGHLSRHSSAVPPPKTKQRLSRQEPERPLSSPGLNRLQESQSSAAGRQQWVPVPRQATATIPPPSPSFSSSSSSTAPYSTSSSYHHHPPAHYPPPSPSHPHPQYVDSKNFNPSMLQMNHHHQESVRVAQQQHHQQPMLQPRPPPPSPSPSAAHPLQQQQSTVSKPVSIQPAPTPGYRPQIPSHHPPMPMGVTFVSQPPVLAPRTQRQFAPIRPRTPMALVEEDKKDPAVKKSSEKAVGIKTTKKQQAAAAAAAKALVPVRAAPPPYRPSFVAYHTIVPGAKGGNTGIYQRVGPGGQGPMMMAVDYPAGSDTRSHPGQPTRLLIPIIPVMYTQQPQQQQQSVPSSTPAKIAPRIHRS